MKKFLAISLIVGMSIPLIWLIVWNFSKKYCEQCISWFIETPFVDLILLTLWPSSILLIGDPTDHNLQLQVISVLVNILFYFIVGALLWLSKTKSFLSLALIIVFYIWWFQFIA